MKMSLEEKFHAYCSNFGTEQDPSKVRHLFDAIYHDDFVNKLDGKHPIDKEQLWQNQSVLLETGTRVTVDKFKHIDNAYTNSVVYKLSFSGHLTGTIHCVYEVKDGKICSGRAVDDSSVATIKHATTLANFYILQHNVQTLFTLFDGVARDLNDEMEDAFNAVYHQDFIHHMDGHPLNTAQWKERLHVFAKSGTKIFLLKFIPYDDVHFEAGIRVINKNLDVVGYSRGTIVGSKLVEVKPHKHSKSAYALMPGQKVIEFGEQTHIVIAQ